MNTRGRMLRLPSKVWSRRPLDFPLIPILPCPCSCPGTCPRGSTPFIGSPHPCTGLPLTNSHNVRSAKLTFHIPHAGVLHGFGGYFEAVLYGNVGISIHPERMALISKDMLSWFPLFFPLKVSLLVVLFDGVGKP